jgi:hypothetical protein
MPSQQQHLVSVTAELCGVAALAGRFAPSPVTAQSCCLMGRSVDQIRVGFVGSFLLIVRQCRKAATVSRHVLILAHVSILAALFFRNNRTRV